jgi:methionine-rich copper-binding protein CopC
MAFHRPELLFAEHSVKRAIFCCIAILFSCKNEDPLDGLLLPGDGKSPQVLLTFPSPGQSGVSPSDQPWVLFSMPMDQQKTQSAFRLSSGTGQIAGGFSWDGTRMIFTPVQALTGNSELTMSIGRDAENESGIDLTEDVTVRFYAQTDTTRPVFVSSNPANGSTGVSTSGDIILTFSEPIDLSTAQSSISVSPASLISYVQNSNRSEVILRPQSNLTPGLYSIQITTGLADISGNSLDQNYALSLTVGSDFSAPALSSVTSGAVTLQDNLDTHGALRTSPLVLQFSEAMDRVSAEGAVSISPFASSVKTWDGLSQTLTISFPSGLDPDTRYTLSIASSAKDAAGNSLLTAHSFPFYTDGSTRPRVLEVREALVVPAFQGRVDNAVASGSVSAPLADFDTIDLAHQIDELPAVGSTDFVIHLRIQFDRSTMVRTSLVSGTSITRILDPSAGNLSIYGMDLAGDTLTLKLYGNPFPGGTGTPIYKLRIADTARDTDGNTMGTDYNLILTF